MLAGIIAKLLELPMSRINFHSPKDFRAIEVGLYWYMTLQPDCYLHISEITRWKDMSCLVSVEIKYFQGYGRIRCTSLKVEFFLSTQSHSRIRWASLKVELSQRTTTTTRLVRPATTQISLSFR